MPAYMDTPTYWTFRGRPTRCAHLWADTLAQLHGFAALIGMRRQWFQVSRSGYPHYDLMGKRIPVAQRAGCRLITDRQEIMAGWERLRQEWQASNPIAAAQQAVQELAR